MNNVNLSVEAGRLMEQLARLRETAASGTGSGSETSPADFASVLRGYVNQVNDAQSDARAKATAFESGDSQVQLIDVMVSMQKSRVAFEALTQVRNRFLSAYQEIMNMQV